MRLVLASVLFAALAAGGCAETASPSPDMVRTDGTVTYMSLEGGFWAIRGDSGTNYDPLGGLPPEFRQEGLRVRVEGRIRTDMASIHMFGTILEITSIRRL